MEKTSLRLLKYAYKNNCFISEEEISKITGISIKPDQAICFYNKFVAYLKEYLEHVIITSNNRGVLVFDRSMRLTVAGKERVQADRRDKFRFWVPKLIQFILTSTTIATSLLLLTSSCQS